MCDFVRRVRENIRRATRDEMSLRLADSLFVHAQRHPSHMEA